MGSQPETLHFVLFPFMAQGHMIPMVDIGCLLAQRGVAVTVVTTPRNSARFEQSFARAAAVGLPINVLQMKLPAVEAGLPEGCENVDTLPTFHLAKNFFHLANSQYDQVEKLLEELTSRPSCIISDMCLHYTNKLAEKFQIPRIQFHGFCCFSLLCFHNVHVSKILERVEWDSEYFTVPGLSEKIELKTNQFSLVSTSDAEWKELHNRLREVEEASYGVIVNSFEELEIGYVNLYKQVKRDKVWCIGPVSLSHNDVREKAHRGNKASVDEHECLRWLDGQAKGSVVYACLGSLVTFRLSQLVELGLGLEASNRPFIWVIRGNEKNPELDMWIARDRIEERVKGRGLLIRGWAPQILILSHPSVGSFLTHCGWNSIVEAISCGVPLITWPLFADQFCNEKLAVRVLRVGVSIGVENPNGLVDEDIEASSLVKKEVIKNVVEKVMDGEEGEERRVKVKQLAQVAKTAVDIGGSSYCNITSFIQDIMQTTSSTRVNNS